MRGISPAVADAMGSWYNEFDSKKLLFPPNTCTDEAATPPQLTKNQGTNQVADTSTRRE
jgi:hypothetical protein